MRNELRVILEQMGVTNEETLENTPFRWSMWLKEFSNTTSDPPRMTTFENPGYDEMVYDRCEFYSLCEHHMLPIFGEVHIAYIPGQTMLGLSKLSRAVDYIVKRPSTQELMTNDLAKFLQEYIGQDLAILIEARHMCKTMRGVQKQKGGMITTYLGGRFKDPAVRAEFLGYTERQ